MPMPSFRSALPGLALGLISAAFMLQPLTVHPQDKSDKSGTSSSGMSSAATGAAGGKISRSDEKMMADLAQINLSQISTSKLALEKSQNNQIKSYAQKMIDDHSKSLDELKQMAQAKGVTLPMEPDRQQKALEKRLSSLSGEKFDRQYLDQEGERAHKDAHKLLKQASTRAQDADLKNYASKALGVFEAHQQMAEETDRSMKSSSHGKSMGGSTDSGTSGKKMYSTPAESSGNR